MNGLLLTAAGLLVMLHTLNFSFNGHTISFFPNWVGVLLITLSAALFGKKGVLCKIQVILGCVTVIYEAAASVLLLLGKNPMEFAAGLPVRAGTAVTFCVNLITALLAAAFHCLLLIRLADTADEFDCPQRKLFLVLCAVRAALSLPSPFLTLAASFANIAVIGAVTAVLGGLNIAVRLIVLAGTVYLYMSLKSKPDKEQTADSGDDFELFSE